MNSPKIYVKDNDEVTTSSKFVYCVSVYKFWKQGASLLNESHCVTTHPLDLKQIPTRLQKKDHSIQRFITLESAPEDFLISKGFKQKQV